ncbi:hypothetical protein BASA81_008815 [Batrachochytrium salamandrivorans]|nr:hypothetical protein BASA81_008815 [Batrachochytrium salamandrivorans]
MRFSSLVSRCRIKRALSTRPPSPPPSPPPSHSNSNYFSYKHNHKPFPARLYEALRLKHFTSQEFNETFDKMDSNMDGKLDPIEIANFLGPELTKELYSHLLILPHAEIQREKFITSIESMAKQIDQRVWNISFSMLLNGTAVGMVVPVLPMLVSQISTGTHPAGSFGLVIGAFALTKIFSNIPSAILADGFGRKPVLTGGLGLTALGTGAIAFSQTFPELLLARLVVGCGVAAFTTASTLYLADVSNPLNRSSSLAPVLSAFSIGSACGPAMGGVLADLLGVNACFAVTGGCFTFMALFNHLTLTETSKFQARNMGSAALDAVKSWAPILQNQRLRSIFLINGVFCISMSGAQTTLLPLILSVDKGYSASEMGMVFASLATVYAVGSPAAGRLADRYGHVKCIAGACSLVTLGLGIFPHHLYPALGLWAVGGTFLGMSPNAYVTDQTSNRNRSQALALMRTIGDVGLLVGAAGSGLVADAVGFERAMEINAGLLGISTLWFLVSSSSRCSRLTRK